MLSQNIRLCNLSVTLRELKTVETDFFLRELKTVKLINDFMLSRNTRLCNLLVTLRVS